MEIFVKLYEVDTKHGPVWIRLTAPIAGPPGEPIYPETMKFQYRGYIDGMYAPVRREDTAERIYIPAYAEVEVLDG